MDYDIETREDGTMQATRQGSATVKLLDEGGRMFRRRAVKFFGTAEPREVCWLVAELNGVRVYVADDVIMITTQDLRP